MNSNSFQGEKTTFGNSASSGRKINAFVFNEEDFRNAFKKQETKTGAAMTEGRSGEEVSQTVGKENGERLAESKTQDRAKVQGLGQNRLAEEEKVVQITSQNSLRFGESGSQGSRKTSLTGSSCSDSFVCESPPPPVPHPREDEEHHFHQFELFRAGGNAPPIPLVGGKRTLTSSFNQRFNNQYERKSSSFGQNLTNSKVERTFPKCQTTNPQEFSNSQFDSECNFDACTMTTNSGTPPLVTTDEEEGEGDGASGEDPDLLLHQARLHSSLHNAGIHQEQGSQNKRQAKAADKTTCRGCHLQFHRMRNLGFCHNCFLIFEAAFICVHESQGTLNFFEQLNASHDTVPMFRIECSQGHGWVTEFKTKEVKKGCRECRNVQRTSRRDLLRAEEEQRIREALRRQQEMLNEAAHGGFSGQFEFITDEDDLGQHLDPFEDTDQSEGRQVFLQVLRHAGMIAPDLTESQLEAMLRFILQQTEQLLIQSFERIDPQDRTRAFRRFALLIHPDKCQSLRAKEAFQLILSCSRWLKNNRGKSIFKTYFIPYLIKLSTAATASPHHSKSAAPVASSHFGISQTHLQRGFFYDIAA